MALEVPLRQKEKILALGVYPDIKLAVARERVQEARELVKQGIDPNTHKREAKARNIALAMETFQVVTEELLTKNAAKWSPSYAEKVQTILAANVLPRIGKIPISTLNAPMVIDAIRPMEARGAIEQAARAMHWAKAIMRYAVVTGRSGTGQKGSGASEARYRPHGSQAGDQGPQYRHGTGNLSGSTINY